MVQSADQTGKKTQPVIAFVGILDKHNEPILLRNYLLDFLQQESDAKVVQAEAALQGADSDIAKIKAAAKYEMDSINMQIQMLVYSTMDVFNDKASITSDRARSLQIKADKQSGKSDAELRTEEDETYLGLLMQAFIDRYEIDVYGLISTTNFKYIVAKIEKRLNPVYVNNTERHIREIFEKIQSFHICMLLNPFFDFDRQIWNALIHGGSGSLSGSQNKTNKSQTRILEDDDDSDYSSSSCSSNNSKNSNEQTAASTSTGQAQGGNTQLNSKQLNKENLDQLTIRIDKFIRAFDNKLKTTY